jgi:hypothetical protein
MILVVRSSVFFVLYYLIEYDCVKTSQFSNLGEDHNILLRIHEYIGMLKLHSKPTRFDTTTC